MCNGTDLGFSGSFRGLGGYVKPQKKSEERERGRAASVRPSSARGVGWALVGVTDAEGESEQEGGGGWSGGGVTRAVCRACEDGASE